MREMLMAMTTIESEEDEESNTESSDEDKDRAAMRAKRKTGCVPTTKTTGVGVDAVEMAGVVGGGAVCGGDVQATGVARIA
jgi:hypothetical protein